MADADHDAARCPARGSTPMTLRVAGVTLKQSGIWAGGDLTYEVRLTPAEVERLAAAPQPGAEAVAEAHIDRVRAEVNKGAGFSYSRAQVHDVLSASALVLARPGAAAGPGLAGAVGEAAQAVVDSAGVRSAGYIAVRADEFHKLRAALAGGAGGGWQHHRTPAQVYRAAKADGLRAALGIVEDEETQHDTKGMGSPGGRLIRLIGDRLRGQIEAVEREGEEPTPPRAGHDGGNDA